jgi:hypothetical protein
MLIELCIAVALVCTIFSPIYIVFESVLMQVAFLFVIMTSAYVDTVQIVPVLLTCILIIGLSRLQYKKRQNVSIPNDKSN